MNFIRERAGLLMRSVMNRKSLTIFSIVIVLIALPLTIFLNQQRQDIRQRAAAISGYAPVDACVDQNFSDLSTAVNAPDLQLAASCLNASTYNYCVVRGFGDNTLRPNDNLTRSEYVAFIVRYHSYVFPSGHPQHWDVLSVAEINSLPLFPNKVTNPTTGKEQFRLLDVPSDYPLAREIYTSQKYGFIRGYEDGTFKPSVTWNYGFHGITRNDVGIDPAYNDSFNGQYSFAAETGQIKRGEFISQLYQYGKDPIRAINGQIQLAGCFQPTAVPVVPTNTPVPQPVISPSTPPTSGGATSCTNTLTDIPQILAEAMGCFHTSSPTAGYCLVKGTTNNTLNPDENLTRAEYVAFIMRYHNLVFPAGNQQHWDLITDAEYAALPASSKFPDVTPTTNSLWREIYTSSTKGFVVGYTDGNFHPNDLWVFGFHGINRTDEWPVGTPYNFTVAGNPITRGTFVGQLFDFGKAKGQLTACFPEPTITVTPTSFTIAGSVTGQSGPRTVKAQKGSETPITVQTNASGAYSFTNLPTGDYFVSLDLGVSENSTPAGYTLTLNGQCVVDYAGCDNGSYYQINFAVAQNTPQELTVTSLVFDKNQVERGQIVTGTAILTNTTSTPVSLTGVVIEGSNQGVTKLLFTTPQVNTTIEPGASYTVTSTYEVKPTDPLEQFFVSLNYTLANSNEQVGITNVPLTISATTPASMKLSVTFKQHGVGNASDNANPNPVITLGPGGITSIPYPSPIAEFMTRTVTVYLSSGQVSQIEESSTPYIYDISRTGTVTYDTSYNAYKGIIELPNVSPGNYVVSIRTFNSLSQQLAGFVTLSSGQTSSVTFPNLVSGNVYDNNDSTLGAINDNQLDILDYNRIMDFWLNDVCSTKPEGNERNQCISDQKRSDLNADGTVDVLDYNLFIRELSVQRGR